MNETLEPVRGLRFIVFHDAYQYFESAFDFPASGAISLSDATDPSPARIAEIKARVADENIQCVLAEPQFDAGLVATVMDGTEARSAVLDPRGCDLEPGPDLYPQLMRNLASALAGCSCNADDDAGCHTVRQTPRVAPAAARAFEAWRPTAPMRRDTAGRRQPIT